MSFYKSREWRELRFIVLANSQRKCSLCGNTSKPLHVDHIKPISKYPELKLDYDNLQVLCEDCNLGKSNKYENDFRKTSSEKVHVKIIQKKEYFVINKDYEYVFLIGKKTAHIVNEKNNNTYCKALNSPQFQFEKYKLSHENNGKNVCKVCINNSDFKLIIAK